MPPSSLPASPSPGSPNTRSTGLESASRPASSQSSSPGGTQTGADDPTIGALVPRVDSRSDVRQEDDGGTHIIAPNDDRDDTLAGPFVDDGPGGDSGDDDRTITTESKSDGDGTVMVAVDPLPGDDPTLPGPFPNRASSTVDDATIAGVPDADNTLLSDFAVDAGGENQTLAGPFAPQTRATDGATVVEAYDEDSTLSGPLPGVEDADATHLSSAPAPDDDATFVSGIVDSADPDRTMVSQGEGEAPDKTRTVGVSQGGSQGATSPLSSPPSFPPRVGVAFGPVSHAPDAERYDLQDNFAKGGLGKIWRAKDSRLQREVAFKELLPHALENRAYFERFLEEAQITGQLEHPGIVPIYDLGWQANGTPYYSMKLVRGTTFLKAIQDFHKRPADDPERNLAFVRLLRQFIDICNAVGFAHARGVIHRDLKPHNVMLGSFGETLVLDWGLAKIIGAKERHIGGGSGSDDETVSGTVSMGSVTGTRQSVVTNVRSRASETVMGSVMGTPAYMPPEQAKGLVDELDSRADIYSLGAILYEILCGKQAIAKGKVVEMLKRVIEGEIARPTEVAPSLPKPLEAIVLKALAKAPEDRYPTAIALAKDVELWLADEPVSVYADPWQTRLRRWVKRHRTAVATASAAAGILIGGGTTVRWLETRRVAGIERGVRLRLDTIDAAATKGDFEAARQTLAAANGELQGAPSLTSLKSELDRVGRALEEQAARREADRLSLVRVDADRRLAAVELEVERGTNLPAALAELTDLASVLRAERSLTELGERVRGRLEAVRALVAERQAIAAAKQRVVDFRGKLDGARFYGSQFTGERPEENAAKASTLARSALELFGPADTLSLKIDPPHLVAEERDAIQSQVYELALILAEAALHPPANESDADRATRLERGTGWLQRAEEAGLRSRTVEELKSRLFRMAGETEKADAATAAAAALQPQTAWEMVTVGELLRQDDGRHLDALEWYRRALERDPKYFLALYFTGVANLQHVQASGTEAGRNDDVRGYLTASLTAFTSCLAERPDFVWPLLLRGVAQASLGDFDAAYEDFARAEKAADTAAGLIDPDLYRYGIAMNRGAVYLQQQRYREAETEFLAARALRPELPDPLVNLSLVRRAQEKDGEALGLLTEALERDGRNAKTWRLRSEVHQRLGDDPAALADQKRWLEAEQTPAGKGAALAESGKVLQRAGTLGEAVNAYRASLELAPDVASTHRLLAEALLALKRPELAVAEFSRYLELSDPVGDVYRARGLAQAQLGNYRGAINDYTRSLELEPSANMLTRRGWAYLLRARQLAIQDFDEAIKLNPANGDSYNGRGYAKALIGDFDGATADAEEAVKRGPPAFEMLFNAATIYGTAIGELQRTASSKLSDANKAERTAAWTKRAVELLTECDKLLGAERRAVLRGAISGDTSFDSLRESEPFVEFWKSIGGQ
jgi:serine/threonine protein kinase/Flp pilus assembly protein TadD